MNNKYLESTITKLCGDAQVILGAIAKSSSTCTTFDSSSILLYKVYEKEKGCTRLTVNCAAQLDKVDTPLLATAV